MDLSKYKNNPKTAYLAPEYERLEREEADILELMKEELLMTSRMVEVQE